MIYVTHDQVEAMTLGDRVAVLDRGRLQQVAPPGELYDRPANAFVAGFIGNPPMNLFPASVELVGRTALLRVGGGTVPIAPGEHLRAGPVTAGVRPEAIEITKSGPDAGGVTAAVEHLENLGHETLAHLRVEGDVHLVARVEGMPAFAKGETVAARLDPARVYLFGEDGGTLARS
jgi:ABC-type sugar transport system ATPase subunit